MWQLTSTSRLSQRPGFGVGIGKLDEAYVGERNFA